MTRIAWIVLAMSAAAARTSGQEADLAERLKQLGDKTLTAGGPADPPLPRRLAADARSRRDAANRRESEAWAKIKTREDWEAYTRPRIEALRRSLGAEAPIGEKPKVRVTRKLEGDGHTVENVLYESRPGLWVSANLYLPAKPGPSVPGILIVHSHHNAKTQGELQDMGVLWASLGCMVLVPDMVGHGERREHPFLNEKSFEGTFRPGRQDYYFRYNSSLQLYALGDSLMGWMVHDLRRGADLLLQRGADRDKIILLGSVAGGGDPAGVTAAVEKRIAVVAPFNFGGPQPETTFPLPNDADASFNYAGGGSWESTRNLRNSARDGFLPWAIVGSVAPRRLIHAHEFAWDRERDPVWKRYQTIFGFYKTPDHLAAAFGTGRLSGRPPESSHCNNIGAVHRQGIYAALKRWFDVPPPEKENDKRRMSADLLCWTAEARKELKPKAAWEAARELGEARAAAFRKRLDSLSEAEGRKLLRAEWAKLLGDIEPRGAGKIIGKASEQAGDAAVETLLLQAEENVLVPMVLLSPKGGGKRPAVVGVCQEGKREFLKQRAGEIAELLKQGVAVCLIDVRGTGESRPDSGRGRQSSATSISATELMLGQTLLGSRLRDLRTVLAHLRTRGDIDAKRLAVWGESFAPVNALDARLAVPLDADKQPHIAEPLGGLLALFAPLFEESLRGGYGRGGLSSYASLLQRPFLYVPHDAVVPGALTAGDLEPAEKALGKRGRQEGRVDGLNRSVKGPPGEGPARWLSGMLKE